MKALFPLQSGNPQLVCPGHRGGKIFQTNAYNPVTGAVYSPVSSTCTNFKIIPLDVSGNGLDNSDLVHMEGSNGQVGRLAAVSAATGRVLWVYDQRAALGSVLTTAGRLVFVGDLHRHFLALDAETGDVLWKVPLSAPVDWLSHQLRDRWEAAYSRGRGGRRYRNAHDGRVIPGTEIGEREQRPHGVCTRRLICSEDLKLIWGFHQRIARIERKERVGFSRANPTLSAT